MAIEPDALTEAMMQALRDEWLATKGSPLPDAGAEDRRLLFAAAARGLLTYLKGNEDAVLRSLDLRLDGGTTEHREVVGADLGIEGT